MFTGFFTDGVPALIACILGDGDAAIGILPRVKPRLTWVPQVQSLHTMEKGEAHKTLYHIGGSILGAVAQVIQAHLLVPEDHVWTSWWGMPFVWDGSQKVYRSHIIRFLGLDWRLKGPQSQVC